MRKNSYFRQLFQSKNFVIGIPYAWFLLLAMIPLFIVLKISLSEMDITSVLPLLNWNNGSPTLKIDFSSYLFIVTDSFYAKAYISSIKYAFLPQLSV